MSGVEAEAVKVGQFILSAVVDRIKTYVNYVKNCEQNLNLVLESLEKLRVEKDDIDDRVLSGKENLEKLTAKATVWLALVHDLVNDELMKKLLKKDMGIAKVMLRLMKNHIKKLVEEDGEMRDVVVKVMKDIAKRKRKAGREVSDLDEKDKEVGRVLEKLMVETMEEFKKLMQNDETMAIAAMHLLENHKEKLEMLTEKDKEVADIIAKAREMSHEEDLLSDHEKDNVVVNVNTLREKVKNMLRPVGDVILNEELLKTLPDSVKLGMDAMGAVIGDRRGLKAELMDSDYTPSHRNCCCCVISCKYFSNRYDMSVAAEVMHDKIVDIIGNKPRIEDVTRPLRRGEMEDIPTNFVGLESRKELLRKIEDALASDDVLALGVFGMGGSGKTTLAKEVANSKAKGIFETAVMVEISESPNVESIQNQIGDGLGLVLHNVHGIHEKAVRLYNKLKPEEESQGKKDGNNARKILIVLDNIWTKIDLIQMGIPREYCKLLLTCRTKDVGKAMDVQEANIFEVGLLSKNEAKDLFKFQVQREVTGEYKSVADRLLEKCGCLPLSIVATANSLKGKELPLWRQFAEELEKPISCQVSGARYETFSILRTSYELMESEEKKKFFLLACLSPLGSSTSIDNLMRYGIGLGLFQHVNKLSEAIDQAHTWAAELMSSSMLLHGDSGETVKIHDVVRESTMSFASKTDLNKDGQMFLVDVIPRWIFKETFNKYIGISLLSQANYARLNGVKADLLQILLLKGNENHSSFLESSFFQGMTNLKVLEMLFMNFEKGLPESMGNLKDLKTLHLVKCKLGDIKLIGELESLLVLNLRGSSLERVPDEIGELHNLRLLDMSQCQCNWPGIPANVIGRLSLLEGLYLFESSFTDWDTAEDATETTSNDSGATNDKGMDELNNLEFLNVLEICMLEPTYFPISAQFVKNLDKFHISIGELEVDIFQPFQRAFTVSDFDDRQELKKDNCLKALLKKADLLALIESTVENIVPDLDEEGFRELSSLQLQELSIRRVCEGEAPSELFLNLCHLLVSGLQDLEELLPLNPVPHKLTTLEISYCGSLTYIFSENGDSPTFTLDDGVNRESDIIELPCLKTLTLDHVTSLVSVVKQSSIDDSGHPSFFNSKVKFPSLENLSLNESGSIAKLWSKESNIHSFQNLKDLKLYCCENMESIGPPSMFASLVQLESLVIEDCNEMEQVISKESDRHEVPDEIITLHKLKDLRIMCSMNLKCFYGGSYKMEFPHLKKVELFYLDYMTKFAGCGSSTTFFHKKIEFPCLEKLDLKELSNEVTVLWDLNEILAEGEGQGIASNPLPKLRDLTVAEIKLPLIVFQSLTHLNVKCAGDAKFLFSSSEKEGGVGAYSRFPNLKYLTVQKCPNSIEQFVEDDGSTAMFKFCGQLTDLKLNAAWNMEVISLHLFKSLRNLNISNLKWEYLFSADGGLQELQLLEELNIRDCPNLEVIIRGGEKHNAIVFPRLKTFDFRNLESLSKFCSTSDIPLHFLSLESLEINLCNKLETLCSGPFVAPSLSELFVGRCYELQCLFSGGPNQLVDLPSLENLRISSCAAMKCFSTRPLKASKLVELSVSSCPKMEWMLPGNTNCGADLELRLPSLEEVVLFKCPNTKSFSPAILRAPKLRLLKVDEEPYSIPKGEDLNQFLQSTVAMVAASQSNIHTEVGSESESNPGSDLELDPESEHGSDPGSRINPESGLEI